MKWFFPFFYFIGVNGNRYKNIIIFKLLLALLTVSTFSNKGTIVVHNMHYLSTPKTIFFLTDGSMM